MSIIIIIVTVIIIIIMSCPVRDSAVCSVFKIVVLKVKKSNSRRGGTQVLPG